MRICSRIYYHLCAFSNQYVSFFLCYSFVSKNSFIPTSIPDLFYQILYLLFFFLCGDVWHRDSRDIKRVLSLPRPNKCSSPKARCALLGTPSGRATLINNLFEKSIITYDFGFTALFCSPLFYR